MWSSLPQSPIALVPPGFLHFPILILQSAKAPLYGVGFSLGANVITRVVGQDGSKTTLKAICPISNPYASFLSKAENIDIWIFGSWDFWKGHLELERSHMGMVCKWGKNLFICSRSLHSDDAADSRAMASNLRRIVKKYEHIFKDDPRLPWRCLFSHPRQSLYQFDNEFTARMGGYSSVEDYYLHASSCMSARIRIKELPNNIGSTCFA